MSAWDTTALLASIRRLAYMPTSTATGSADADLLALANFEMQSSLVPRLRRCNEEFFVTQTDVPVAVGQASYNIPSRAAGATLRDIQAIVNGSATAPLARLNITDLPALNPFGAAQTGVPIGFYLSGNQVTLYPAPSSSSFTSLRLFYERRPNDLVATATSQRIASIDTGALTVTTGAAPSSIVTGDMVDLIRGSPHFDTLAMDLTLADVTGAVLTLPSLPSAPFAVAVGDYVLAVGTSPVPQLPVGLHEVLAQRVAVKLLESRGDPDTGPQSSRLVEMEKAAFDLLTPRIKGKPRRVLNHAWAF